MLISHQNLRAGASRIFLAAGSQPEEAETVADHLVEANLRGHDSHGVGMIPIYLDNLRAGTLRANTRGTILRDDGATVVYDGERGYGQIAARTVTSLGIERAHETGIVVVALRNSHHIGRIGSYGEQCAAAGLVSLHFVNVTGHRPYVAPHRGSDGRLATNPVCIAVPGGEAERDVILDMATSKVPVGKVRVAANEGRALAPGLLMDAKGRPTTDPSDLYGEPHGALLPLGEHKGYALGFLCDLLAGAVGGGGTLRPENQGLGTITNSMLAFILNPSRFVERDWLRAEVMAIADYVTLSPPHTAGEPVLIPGDPERLARQRRLAEGIPVDDVTRAKLLDAARSLGLDLEKELA